MTSQPDSQSIKLNENSQQVEVSARKRKRGSTYPAWSVWQRRGVAKVWEAVALSKNINPSKLEITKIKDHKRYQGFTSRLKTAEYWLADCLPIQVEHPSNGILPRDKFILLSKFVQCAQKNGMTLCDKLVEIVSTKNELSDSQVEAESLPLKQAKSSRNSLRNKSMQEAASRMAQELAKTLKRPITRREVASKLYAQGDFKPLESSSIERILRAKWK